jgi:hypothetical protein
VAERAFTLATLDSVTKGVKHLGRTIKWRQICTIEKNRIHLIHLTSLNRQPLIFIESFYFLYTNELLIEFWIILNLLAERLKRYKYWHFADLACQFPQVFVIGA